MSASPGNSSSGTSVIPPVADDPRREYQRRLAHWIAAIDAKERIHLRVSNLRLAAVGVGALLLWLSLGQELIAGGWIFVPVAAFFVLVIVHARILNAQDRAKRGKRYFERGLARLDHTWQGAGADGARFAAGHPYALDLDLFGPGSLFQLLDTAVTEAGEETLADWLRSPAAPDEIVARQGAIRELRGRTDLREALAIAAAEAHVSRTGTLTTWAKTSPVGFAAGHAWFFGAMAAVTAVLTLLAAFTSLTADVVVIWLIVQGVVVATRHKRIDGVLRRVDAAERDLALLAALLARIERESFVSPRLQAWHRQLMEGDQLPSQLFGRLRFFIAVRDAPRNEFVRPFAMALLARSQAAVAIDRWQAAHRDRLARWIAAIGELEAFCALATFAFEHPADPFPVVADGRVFDAEQLGHPLIDERVAVANDVRLGGDGPRVLIVSGSNMSGKSTLLRAVGINAVLAMAGAPVRARAMTLSPLTLGATMRIEDSLQEGHSRFYAEVLRIRDIVANARLRPVLFMLDEILHGTNSHDRRIGAAAIVQALVNTGAIGLVTTHDLALTALTETLGARARNVHFEDRIEDGRMVFDYRMRDGVVERSNALELMRSVGLDV